MVTRDLSSLQDAHVKAFIGPDSNLKVTIHAGPVQHQDTGGNWQDLSPGIDPVTRKATGVPFDVVFGQKITDSGAVQFQGNVGTAKFSLQGYGLAGLEEVPFSSDGIITSKGEVVYYTNWGKVVYKILPTGLKETVHIEKDVLKDPTQVGISLTGLTVNLDFGFAPVDFEGPVTAVDARGTKVEAARSVNGVEITYKSYTKAVLPIVIDPTLTASGSNCGYVDNTGVYGSNEGTDYAGISESTDSTGIVTTTIYRQFARFDISAYKGYTVYGTCTYSVFPTVAGSLNISVIQVNDFGSISASTFNYTQIADLADNILLSTTGYQVLASIKNNLIKAKGSVIAFAIRATNEGASGTFTQSSLNGGASLYQPKIDFQAYNTLTQNAPAVGSGQVQVNWVNGGGLVSGDLHHIYYMAGTGLTAAQVIANGIYVSSTAYTDTNVVVTGLTSGTSYCFVVVDAQNLGGTYYEGAVSNVQAATPTGPKTTYSVSIGADTSRSLKAAVTTTPDTTRQLTSNQADNTDTARKVFVVVNAVVDTGRKVIQTVQAGLDTLRKVITATVVSIPEAERKVVVTAQANPDSYRKVTNTINTGADTTRRLQKLISTATDTIRRITLIEVINFAADLLRKVVRSARATPDTKRKLVITDTPKAETDRRTQVIIVAAVETLRRFAFAVNFMADSLRQVGNWITRSDPKYTFVEVVAPYAFTENISIYSFKGDVQLYMMRVGEQREVGITGTSSDGSQFSLSATYVWVDTSGNILAQGSADIEGVNVFTMLGPTKVGRTTLTFTVTVTPLDSSGAPDQSRKPETYLVSVTVKVLP